MSDRILASLDQNISTGLAARAFFETQTKLHDEISAKIDNHYYTNVYNLLANALQSDLLLTVTRVWDRSPDSHSFPNLVRQTDWEKLRSELEGDRWQHEREQAIENLIQLVEEFLDSDQLRALLVARAEGVAHAIETSRERKKMIVPRVAKFGELYQALDISVTAFNFASLAIRSSQTAFDLISEDFTRYSRQFLNHLPDLNTRK